MEQSIIVLYVDDVGQRRWAGPFWDEKSAMDFGIEKIKAGTMTAACNTRGRQHGMGQEIRRIVMIKHPFKFRDLVRWLRILGDRDTIAALRCAMM